MRNLKLVPQIGVELTKGQWSIRAIEPSDMAMIDDWFIRTGGSKGEWDFFDLENVFIVNYNERPVLSLAVIPSTSRYMWLENFIGNPDAPKFLRREGTKFLLNWIEDYGRKCGYRRMFCMSPNDGLTTYYESLGFLRTATVDTFIKEL